MISRLTLPIDLLHDERIVALVADCGPQSIAVLISLLAIQRRRDSITRDRFLIAKIRHDLSFTLDEAVINVVLDHLLASGYISLHREEGESRPLKEKTILCHEEEASGDTGGMGRLAPSGDPSANPSANPSGNPSGNPSATPSCSPAAVASADSVDSLSEGAGRPILPVSPDVLPPVSPEAPASLPHLDISSLSIPEFSPGVRPFFVQSWPHPAPYTLEEVIAAYRFRDVRERLDRTRESERQNYGLNLDISESLAVRYYEEHRHKWLNRSGATVQNLAKSLCGWIRRAAIAEAKFKAEAAMAAKCAES